METKIGTKKHRLYIFLVLWFVSSSYNFAQTEDLVITKLFQDSYHTIKSMRHANSIYLDKLMISGNDPTIPGAIVANGVGLISLCIADAMYKKTSDAINWEPNAAAFVDTTLLKFIEFRNNMAINTKGLFRRYFDIHTGRKYKDWTDEYSTIDNAIFAMGLIYCKNYFSDNLSIVNNVNTLLGSMDFSAAISDDSLSLYMVLDSSGHGITSTITRPFNEYMIVAWLAKNLSALKSGYNKSQFYWNTYYSNPKSNLIPKPNYWGYELISDGGFISDFIPLFTYYYCHYYKNNIDYMDYFNNARKADSLWWTKAYPGINSYEWGLGAGDNPGGGYSANAIDNNSIGIVSPQIMSGFLPIYAQGKSDLKTLYNKGTGLSVYQLPSDTSRRFLWRYSHTNTSQRCTYVQAVDFSTMLYGLASLPEYLGPDFFDSCNNISPTETDVKVINNTIPLYCSLKQNYPNPFNPTTTISFDISSKSFVSLKIYDILGKEISVLILKELSAGLYACQWNTQGLASGIYFYHLQVHETTGEQAGSFVETKKLILIR